MVGHIPTDLIRRVQLLLRDQAGLASYDPDDPSLPAVPSLRQSVATFDPSPAELRCKHCHGRLLRGIQSAICVYCGGRQPKEVLPEPIAFESTAGYRWLLQSLDLDGSVIVGPVIEEHAINRGQSSPQDKVTLSDLLNVEIPWTAKAVIMDHSLLKNASVQSRSLTDLAGVGLDNFFVKKDFVSNLGEEQAVASGQNENMKLSSFAKPENQNFFPTTRHSVPAVSSNEAKDIGDFFGWEADFQSADSGNQPEASKSLDPAVSSTIDLSIHMDSVFGSGKHLEDDKPKDVLTPSVSASGGGTQGDLWNNSKFLSSDFADQVETTMEVKDRKNAENITPSSIDRFPDDHQQTQKTITTENRPTARDDDSFDVGNSFAGSSNPPDPPETSFPAIEVKPITGDDDSFDVWTDFTSSYNAQDASKSSFTAIDDKPDAGDAVSSNVWNDFTGFSSAQDPSKGSVTSTDDKPDTGNDDLSNVWNDFTSSSSAQDPSWSYFSAKPTAVNDKFSDVWDGFPSSSNAQDHSKSSFAVTDNKQIIGDDAWDDFTSSSNAQNPSNSSLNQSTVEFSAVGEQTSDNMLSSLTDNFQEMDFGSFSQSDVSGSVSYQNGAMEVDKTQSVVSAPNRMNSEEVEIDDVGLASKGDYTLNSAMKSEDDKENLLMEMHDLSFMLKTELSVPTKTSFED